MDEWDDANERSSVGFSDKSGTHIHGVEVGYILFAYVYVYLCFHVFRTKNKNTLYIPQ